MKRHLKLCNFKCGNMVFKLFLLIVLINCSIIAGSDEEESSSSSTSSEDEDYNDSDYNDSDFEDSEDDNDTMGNYDSEDLETKKLPFNLSDNADDIRFMLFRNPSNESEFKELFLNDTESVDQSGFKSDQNTVFIIHGFWSNSTSGMPTVIKKGYLDAQLPYNIIVVDWGKLSAPEQKSEPFARLSYPVIVSRNIPITYQRIADFIQFLVDNKYASLENIHLVGHSLGAHVSGGVGHVLANNTANEGSKLARISGLDPAGPLFQGIKIQRRLSDKDADFVDIYHTAAGTLGNVIYKEGDADFFPNGGHHQPGCVDFAQPVFFEAEFGSCSHSFISKIYAASITRNFTACECDPLFIDYIAGSICPGNCSVTVLAGEPCPSSARGQFYFETSENPFEEEEVTGSGSSS